MTKSNINGLTQLIKNYNSLFKEFENRKTLFNLRVDDLCDEYKCGLYPAGLSEEEVNEMDAYSKAKHFFATHDSLVKGLNRVRESNPDTCRKRLVSLYTRYLIDEFGYDYALSYLYVSNYMIFIEAGFYKTLNSEFKADQALRKITRQSETLKQQGIDVLDDFIKDTKAKVEPYAKDAADRVRPLVHEGSKRIAKVFTKLADKTQKKND